MGGRATWGTVVSYQSTGSDLTEALKYGQRIVNDPYLPEVVCELNRISRLEEGLSAGASCRRTRATPAQIRAGAGLRHLPGPLRLFAFHQQNPWVLPVAIGTLLAGLAVGGYYVGSRRRK